MDSLITQLSHIPLDKLNWTYIIVLILGSGIPIVIGMILPRKGTVGYGRFLYKWIGGLLVQKRIHPITGGLINGLLTTIRSTFVDLSFGVYLESRTDITEEEKTQKVDEYLKITQPSVTTPQDPTPPAPTPQQ